MDPIAAFAAEIKRKIDGARIGTSRGVVTSVNGGEVKFTIGGGLSVVGRWVGATPPVVGEVVTYLDEGRGYPLVLGPTGRDALADLFEWKTYTPLWRGTGGNPILNNGAVSGRYMQAPQWVMVEIRVKAGSLTDFGIGPWSFGLPVTAQNFGDHHELSGHLFDYSTGRIFPLKGIIQAGQSFVFPMYHSVLEDVPGGAISNSFVSASLPFTFADADACTLFGIYPVG